MLTPSVMSKPIPTIQKFMSTSPHAIGQEQTLGVAKRVMSDHHIRHLPVLHGGRLVGVLSNRDIALIEGLAGVDADKVTVEEAMTSSVHSTSPDTPLNEVTKEMAERKYGCTVVVQSGKVVGIFTTVDACRALSELLETRLSH